MPAPSATPITLPFSVTLGPFSEPQWYVFTTTEALDFFVSTEGSPTSSNDTALALYDSVGDVVAENEDVLGGDYRSRIDVPALPAGTYYIGLTGFPISTGPDWFLSGGESNAGSGVFLEAETAPVGSGGGGDPDPGDGGGGSSPGAVAMDANARLEKISRRTFVPGSPGSPGEPGQPFIPARRVIDVQTICTYSPYTEVTGVQIVNGQPVPTINPSVYTCRDVFSERIIPAQPYIAPSPAVPATPAQTLNDFQFGWNSRARSKPAIVADGAFNFRVTPSSVGVVIGLVPQSDPVQTSGYSDIRWGFYVARGNVRIYENGQEVDNLGPQPNAKLTLRRRLGQIVYLVDDIEVRTVPNESVPLVLSAAMFSGGDTVSFAEMVPEAGASGEGVMRPMIGIGGTVPYAFGDGEMAPMSATGSSRSTGTGGGTMAPMIGLGGQGQYAASSGRMAPMTGSGEGGDVSPPYAVGNGYFGVMISTASGLSGGMGSGSASLQPMVGLGSDRPYADGRGVMAPVTGYAANLNPPNEALVVSIVVAQQPMTAEPVLMVVMDSEMGLQSLLAVQPIVPASMPAAVGFDASWLTTQQIEVLLQSVMRASVTVGDPSAIEERSVWVLSLDVMGSTRYEGYDFNSFAEVGGRYFGMRADGLYLLQGEDDNGRKIPARVNLGRPNMGDLSRKGLPYVYVGAASNGVLVLKVVADGRTYYYRASSDSAEVRTHRFTPGLGLRATNYDLEIQNDDGGAFDMASIEFVPVKLSRRI